MGSCCGKCYEFCCGERKEANIHSQLLDAQRVTTIRRISSVGITVLNEDGEESEIPRHSSILQSYNSVGVPWTSTPLPIQPGVTKEDIASRIKALPTIVETPPSKQKSRGWKKALTGSKGEFSFDKKSRETPKTKTSSDIQLTLFQKVNENYDVSMSQDDIVHRGKSQKDLKAQALRRTSYSSSPNLFAMKGFDKSSQHMMTHSRQDIGNPDGKRSSWLDSQSVGVCHRCGIKLAVRFCEQLLLSCTASKAIATPSALCTSELIVLVTSEALNQTCRECDVHQLKDVSNEEEESEASKLARQYGLDLSLYIQNDITSSNDTNIKTEPLKFWQERYYGTVDVIVSLDSLQKLLTLTIDGVRGLSGVGPHRQAYPIVFKISLLNDKKNIKTSRKLAGASNLKVNQTFNFHVKDINSRGFSVSVYHAEFLGRHDAIGHALFNIMNATKELKTFPLKLGRPSTFESCSAVIEVMFWLKETLNIHVIRVSKLPQRYRDCRFYVKESYFSLSKKAKERVSTASSKEENNDTIAVDHLAKFKIDPSGQKHSYVMLSLKICSSKLVFRKNDKTVGRIFLGPCFYYDDGTLTPWGKVVLKKEQFGGSFQMHL